MCIRDRIIIAPAFSKGALDIFKNKKNLRVIEIHNLYDFKSDTSIRSIHGGLLLQQEDEIVLAPDTLKTVTQSTIDKSLTNTVCFGWSVLKYIKSNAILIAKDCATLSVGAGQVSRVDSVDIAINKLNGNLDGAILLSDAFFPFRDSIDKIAQAGIKTIVQPGGSVKDHEVIDACNEFGIAMLFTGSRCFRH